MWSFHLNWLIFLEAVYANKRVPFILVHNVYVLIYIDFISHFLMPLQPTNTKWFLPVAVDNIIRDFVFCPKIVLHAAISQNPTTHKFLQHICVGKHSLLGPEYTEKLTASGVLCFCPQTPYRCSAPGPHWGTTIPQTPCLFLFPQCQA